MSRYSEENNNERSGSVGRRSTVTITQKWMCDLTLPVCSLRLLRTLRQYAMRPFPKTVLFPLPSSETSAVTQEDWLDLFTHLNWRTDAGVICLQLNQTAVHTSTTVDEVFKKWGASRQLSSLVDKALSSYAFCDFKIPEDQEAAATVQMPSCDTTALLFLYSVAAQGMKTPLNIRLQRVPHSPTLMDHLQFLRLTGLDIVLRETKRDVFGLWSTLEIWTHKQATASFHLKNKTTWMEKILEHGQIGFVLYLLSHLAHEHQLPDFSQTDVFKQNAAAKLLERFLIRTHGDSISIRSSKQISFKELVSSFQIADKKSKAGVLHGLNQIVATEAMFDHLEKSAQGPKNRALSKNLLIAIDGPAGAGKSTVSKMLARRLNYQLIDTGAMFRSVATCAREKNIPLDDVCALEKITHQLHFKFSFLEGDVQVWVRVGESGEFQDWSEKIRTSEVGILASRVSILPTVRAILLSKQREMGRDGKVVMEGRDIGSVVFPDAELKFFLTASVRARAQRRWRELINRGESPNLEDVEQEIRLRDSQDMQREVAPLVVPKDAEVVDASELSILEAVDHLQRRVTGFGSNA